MALRLFNLGVLIFAALFTATVLLTLAALRLDAKDHYLSLARAFHVDLLRFGAGAAMPRLAFFNDAEYGPYRGSIIALSDGDGPDPSLPKVTAFGDSFGIYYRHIEWPTGAVIWTLAVSLWYPLLLFGAGPGVWLVRRWRLRGSCDRSGTA
jgi:hypothetical protein